MTSRDGSPRRAALLVVAALAAVFQANFLLDWVLRGGDGMQYIVSQLAAPGQPNATLLRATDVACAVLVLVLVVPVRRALRPGPWREVVTWGTVAFAVGAIGAALAASTCPLGTRCVGSGDLEVVIHDLASAVSEVGLFGGVLGAWFATRRDGPAWFHAAAQWVFVLGGVVSALMFAYFTWTATPGTSSTAAALSQRLHILTVSAWLVCLGVLAARADGPGGATALGARVEPEVR
ncbi:DUF998 domain-containing protein [Beutenbergia cavernae]|uniref:DUF998 domain-containing protein n=1 Tax=Beutenbergia cavernae TaxID=84757 RepID=UPI00019AD1E6|nr:DUF998 domain-containing protein [Beutenbergia cavernae]